MNHPLLTLRAYESRIQKLSNKSVRALEHAPELAHTYTIHAGLNRNAVLLLALLQDEWEESFIREPPVKANRKLIEK
jgi:hypothetical protein